MNSTVLRAIFDQFTKKVVPGKVLILLGARRVGKSELIKQYMETLPKQSFLFFNGEDQRTIDLLAVRSLENYSRLLGGRKLLIIDEAQKIPDIGNKLKLMVDSFPELAIIATGSSIFDLTNKLGEPLVGREHTLYLYPLAQLELSRLETYPETRNKLEDRLIFGGYPELLQYDKWDDKADYLEGIINSYLLRDVLAFQGIRKADKIMDLLRLLAFQVGKEVNIDELANNLKGVSRNTVENYLDLLSKVFIIYTVKGYSNNLRKEVTKMSRWYFYDNGIMNAVVRNFNSFSLRMDQGALFENYLMSERIKRNAYKRKRINQYFWRTYDQQEIDLVEEEAGKLAAFEFKWNIRKKVKAPGAWTKAYPDATFEVIHQENYLDFIL